MKEFVVSWSSPSTDGKHLAKLSTIGVWQLDMAVEPRFISSRLMLEDVQFEGKEYENSLIEYQPRQFCDTKILFFVTFSITNEKKQKSFSRRQPRVIGFVYNLDQENGKLSFEFEWIANGSAWNMHLMQQTGLLFIPNDGIEICNLLEKGRKEILSSTDYNWNGDVHILTTIGSKFVIFCKYNTFLHSEYFLYEIETENVECITDICPSALSICGWSGNDYEIAILLSNEVIIYSFYDRKIIWKASFEMCLTKRIFMSYNVDKSIVFQLLDSDDDEGDVKYIDTLLLTKDNNKYKLDILGRCFLDYPLLKSIETQLQAILAPPAANCKRYHDKDDDDPHQAVRYRYPVFVDRDETCPTMTMVYMHKSNANFQNMKKDRLSRISSTTRLLKDLSILIVDYEFYILVNDMQVQYHFFKQV